MTGLLARTGQGDRHAFNELYRLSAASLLPYAFRIVKTSALAEDILQESYIAIWRDAASFDGQRAAPLTWMAAIVRNKAVDYLRANHLASISEPFDDATPLGGWGLGPAQPCDAAANAQRIVLVAGALGCLAAQPRRAIELAYFQDLSHGEVALAMMVPLGTVKTWIRRGCQSLKRHVEPGLR